MIKLKLLIASAAGIALLVLGFGAMVNRNVLAGLIPVIFGALFIAISVWIYMRRKK